MDQLGYGYYSGSTCTNTDNEKAKARRSREIWEREQKEETAKRLVIPIKQFSPKRIIIKNIKKLNVNTRKII